MKEANRIPNFSAADLRPTIFSNGWYSLQPFSFCINPPSITFRYALPQGNGQITVSSKGNNCFFKTERGSVRLGEDIVSQCLSLDFDIGFFHELLRGWNLNEWMNELPEN